MIDVGDGCFAAARETAFAALTPASINIFLLVALRAFATTTNHHCNMMLHIVASLHSVDQLYRQHHRDWSPPKAEESQSLNTQ